MQEDAFLDFVLLERSFLSGVCRVLLLYEVVNLFQKPRKQPRTPRRQNEGVLVNIFWVACSDIVSFLLLCVSAGIQTHTTNTQ